MPCSLTLSLFGLFHSIGETEFFDLAILVVHTPGDYLEQSSDHEVSQCWQQLEVYTSCNPEQRCWACPYHTTISTPPLHVETRSLLLVSIQSILVFFPRSFDTPLTRLQCFENVTKSDDRIGIRVDNYMTLGYELHTTSSTRRMSLPGKRKPRSSKVLRQLGRNGKLARFTTAGSRMNCLLRSGDNYSITGAPPQHKMVGYRLFHSSK